MPISICPKKKPKRKNTIEIPRNEYETDEKKNVEWMITLKAELQFDKSVWRNQRNGVLSYMEKQRIKLIRYTQRQQT